jgi:hypothetical protein
MPTFEQGARRAPVQMDDNVGAVREPPLHTIHKGRGDLARTRLSMPNGCRGAWHAPHKGFAPLLKCLLHR